MKLELQDAQGLTGVFIEVPLEQLKEEIGLVSSSPETEAQLQESQGKVAELEEKLAAAEGKTMAQFTREDKANFVIAWAKGLSPEDKAIFAEAVELPIAIATEAEVAEAEAKGKVEPPKTIKGRTTRPGYKFLEYLNLSVRED